MGNKLKKLNSLLLFMFLMFLSTTIAYAGLSTKLAITAEAKFRPVADIRVTGISLSSVTGSARLQYEPEYNVNSTTTGFILPDTSSTITYKVTVANNGTIDQTIYNMITASTNNNNVSYTISGYNLKDPIPFKSSVTFYITFKTTSGSNTTINYKINYDFRKLYKVEYDSNGGENVPENQMKYENVDLTITSDIPTKEGYKFKGWSDSKTDGTIKYTPESNYTLDKDILLYAVWEINTYKLDLSYNVDGTWYYEGYNNRILTGIKVDGIDKGYLNDFDLNVGYGKEYEIYGFKLDGVNIPYSKKYIVDGTNHLNISFYTINFVVNNNEYGEVDTQNLIVLPGTTFEPLASTLTLSDSRKVKASLKNLEGYTTEFSNFTYNPNSTTINSKTTITANFTRKINQYTLTVKPNGGTWDNSTNDKTFKQNYNTTRKILVPSSNAYYSISYDANGGTILSSGNITASRDFTGWSLTGKGSITKTEPLSSSFQTYTYGASDDVLTANYNSTANTITTATVRRSHTITYNANNTGASIGKLSEKISDVMNGWYTKASGGEKRAENGGKYAPTASEKLYAQWTKGTVTLPTIKKTGYTCSFNTKADGTGTSYESGSSGYSIDSDTTLYGICEASSYKITWDRNYLDSSLWTDTHLTNRYSSSGTAPTAKTTITDNTVKYGQYIEFTMPTGTSRGPYYLNSTYLTAGSTYTWSVYVKASSAKTLIIGQEQGGTQTVNVTTSWQKLTYTFTAKEYQYKGFIFYLTSGSTWSEGDKLYVHSLEIMEGTPTNTTSTKTYGATLGTLPTPDSRIGYTFNGWFTSATGGTKINSSTVVKSDSTYYAKWTPNTYAISLDNQDVTTTGTQTIFEKYETGIYLDENLTQVMTTSTNSIRKPIKNGYTFKGYYTGKDGTGIQMIDENGYITGNLTNNKYTSNTTLYAYWKINKVNIQYDMNGGRLGTINNNDISTSGSLITYQGTTIIHALDYGSKLGEYGLYDYNNPGFINLVRTGYYINSNYVWNKNPDGTGRSYNQVTQYSASDFCDASYGDCTMTLYANWYPNALIFDNQTKDITRSTNAQTIEITGASNGTGNYIYSEISEKNSSNTATNYISISGTTITVAANIPADTYKYVIRATDSNSNVTKDATITIKVNKLDNPIVVTATDSEYTGSSQPLVSVKNAQGNVYYSTSTQLTSSNYTSGSTTIPSATNGGTYTVYYYVTGNDNYNSKSGSVESTISYLTYEIRLDNKDATTPGTSVIYGRYGDGIYLDSNYTKHMTLNSNPITIPKREYNLTLNYNDEYSTTSDNLKVDYTFLGYINTEALVTYIDGNGYLQTMNEFNGLDVHSNEALQTATVEWEYNGVTLPTEVARLDYTFLGWYTNAIGGTKVTNSTEITEDTTIYAHWIQNPAITGGSDDWTNTSRTISVEENGRYVTDVEITKYQYYKSTSSMSLVGGTWTDCTTSSTSQTFTDEGEYYIFFRSVSSQGYSNPSNSQIVRIDKTAPGATSSKIRYESSTGKEAQNDTWTNRTLWWGDFTANDTLSGINHYEYSDGCTGTKSGNLESYTSEDDKVRAFCIRAVDNAGNAGAWSEPYVFKVDKTPPEIAQSKIRYDSSTGAERTNANTWTNKTLWWGDFFAWDNYPTAENYGAASGINHYEYSTNCTGEKTGNLSSEYTYDTQINWTFCIRAVDNAGNAGAWSDPYYFKIDKTSPKILGTIKYTTKSCSWSGSCTVANQSESILNANTTINGWNSFDYAVDWTETIDEGGSGIKSVTWSINDEGASSLTSDTKKLVTVVNKGTTPSNWTQNISTAGARYAEIKVEDNAGNIRKVYITTYVDKVNPKITLKAYKTNTTTQVSSGTTSDKYLSFIATTTQIGLGGGTIKYCGSRTRGCTPNLTTTSGARINRWYNGDNAHTTGTWYVNACIMGNNGTIYCVPEFTAKVSP
ncbi:MAG: InlB B-repeat-containing protein [Bacilli bacterium]|nr:InlB B-repeat-containing protein [Bacilli bacterium]MBP3635553.1 InlB B-repeat-containing protein [Bacilli bacterium]